MSHISFLDTPLIPHVGKLKLSDAHDEYVGVVNQKSEFHGTSNETEDASICRDDWIPWTSSIISPPLVQQFHVTKST